MKYIEEHFPTQIVDNKIFKHHTFTMHISMYIDIYIQMRAYWRVLTNKQTDKQTNQQTCYQNITCDLVYFNVCQSKIRGSGLTSILKNELSAPCTAADISKTTLCTLKWTCSSLCLHTKYTAPNGTMFCSSPCLNRLVIIGKRYFRSNWKFIISIEKFSVISFHSRFFYHWFRMCVFHPPIFPCSGTIWAYFTWIVLLQIVNRYH